MKLATPLFILFLLIPLFVFDLSAQCVRPAWLVHGGGSNDDYGHGMSMDEQDNILLTGSFNSDQLILGTDTLSIEDGNNYACKLDAAGQYLWAVNLGTGFFSNRIISADNGQFIIAGTFYRNAVIGTDTLTSLSRESAFVAKFDSSGQLVWQQAPVGRSNGSEAFDVAKDESGNIYLTGALDGDFLAYGTDSIKSIRRMGLGDNVFTVSFTANGDCRWINQGGTSNTNPFRSGRAVEVGTDGYVYVAGHVAGDTYFDDLFLDQEGSFHLFLVKYDPADGRAIRLSSFGGPEDYHRAFLMDLVLDEKNNCYVVGECNGGFEWGRQGMLSTGGSNLFVGKIDTGGVGDWIKVAEGGDIYDLARRIDYANGKLAVAAYNSLGRFTFDGYVFSEGGSMITMKIDTSGQTDWVRNVAIDNTLWNWGIGIAGDGAVYANGNFTSTQSWAPATASSNGQHDYFLVKYTESPIDTNYQVETGIRNGASNSLVCGSRINLTSEVTPFTRDYMIFWTPYAELQELSRFSKEPSINPIENTTYTMNVLIDGCIYQDSIDIAVEDVEIDLGMDQRICPGDSVRLAINSNQNGLNFQWNNTSAISDSLSYWLYLFPDSTTAFILTANRNNCPPATDTLLIDVIGGALFAEPTLDLCQGDSLELKPIQIDTSLNYQWSPADHLSANDTASPLAWPSTSRWYYLHLDYSEGCQQLDSVFVELRDLPTINLGQDSTLCANATIQLSIPDSFPHIRWSTGDTTSQITLDSSQHDLPIWVEVADEYLCQGRDSIQFQFEVCTTTKLAGTSAIDIQLSPNPVHNSLHLQFNQIPGGSAALSILSLNGQPLFRHSLTDGSHSKNIELALANKLAKGMYMLQLQWQDGTVWQQLFVRL